MRPNTNWKKEVIIFDVTEIEMILARLEKGELQPAVAANQIREFTTDIKQLERDAR